MYRDQPAPPRSFTLEELEDQHDLRAVIAAALAATPLETESLRRGVWTYVRAEHHLGTSPGAVIVALTALVEGSTPRAPLVQQALMRQVILWCVEAYFGHLGGEGVHLGDQRTADEPAVPRGRRSSNR
ncbi:MAG TPA: hypothetical protein VJW73_05960 [Gemmatimonadaceae bacterium]|nr:hypothetical protein [Gemmatimonadaceae bacterium]